VETLSDGSVSIPVFEEQIVGHQAPGACASGHRAQAHVYEDPLVHSQTCAASGSRWRVTATSSSTTKGAHVTTPDGKTPRVPDNDTDDDAQHGGESELEASGRTPRAADQAEGDDDSQV
jgi:hypothetical protein